MDSYVQCCILFLPQDMEALKRSLALIESKMRQAKSWLKEPHEQTGNWIFCHALLYRSDFTVSFHNVILLCVSVPRRPRRGWPPCDSRRSWQGGRAVCWKREERHTGDHKGPGTNDRPDSRFEGPVVCLRERFQLFS